MKIQKILNQHRRDFNADMKCEFCGHVDKNVSGYDDRYFHSEVIPGMECSNCKKSTKSEGGKIDNTATKYPEGLTV